MGTPNEFTCERSTLNPLYFRILLNGRLWRVCHENRIDARMAELNA